MYKEYDLTFVADLPGLKLENYVSEHMNASVEVLKGKVNLEIEYETTVFENSTKKISVNKKNYTLGIGDKISVRKFAVILIFFFFK